VALECSETNALSDGHLTTTLIQRVPFLSGNQGDFSPFLPQLGSYNHEILELSQPIMYRENWTGLFVKEAEEREGNNE